MCVWLSESRVRPTVDGAWLHVETNVAWIVLHVRCNHSYLTPPHGWFHLFCSASTATVCFFALPHLPFTAEGLSREITQRERERGFKFNAFIAIAGRDRGEGPPNSTVPYAFPLSLSLARIEVPPRPEKAKRRGERGRSPLLRRWVGAGELCPCGCFPCLPGWPPRLCSPGCCRRWASWRLRRPSPRRLRLHFSSRRGRGVMVVSRAVPTAVLSARYWLAPEICKLLLFLFFLLF